MKKSLIGVLIVAIVLAAVAVALPWWFGLETEKAFRVLVAASDRQSSMPTDIKRYERGWLSTTAETIARHPTLPLEIHSHHTIRHGPMTSGTDIGLARIESRMTLHTRSAQHQQEVSRIPALQATTTIGLDGQGRTRFEHPPWTRPGSPTLTWEGLRGEIRFDREWKNLTTELHAPALRVSADKVELFRLEALRLTSNLKQGVSGLYLGKNDLTVDKVIVRHPARPAPVELHGVSVHSHAQASGPETINLSILYRLRELRMDGTRHGPSELLLEFRRLDAAALQAYEKKLQKLAREGKPPEQISIIMLGESLKLLGVMARRSPEMEIKRLSLRSDKGELSGKGKLVIDGSRANIAENPLLLLTALQGDVELRVPPGYVRPLLEPIIRQDMESLSRSRQIGREDMKAMSTEKRNAIITDAMPHYLSRHPLTRLLIPEGDHYLLKATLRRGELMINGKPWSGGTPLPVPAVSP